MAACCPRRTFGAPTISSKQRASCVTNAARARSRTPSWAWSPDGATLATAASRFSGANHGRRKILQTASTEGARTRGRVLCLLQESRAALPALRRLRRLASYPARYVREVRLPEMGVAAFLG